MKFWAGVTDNNWFGFLANRGLDEVNFWQPSPSLPFSGGVRGTPFLFKLKSPHSHIAGGGFLVTFSTLPLSLAWEIFGEKNGANSLDEFESILKPLAHGKSGEEIGCTVLANPFFFPRELWISDIPEWSPQIVRGKMYDTGSQSGALLWEAVKERISLADSSKQILPSGVTEPGAKYGAPAIVNPRLGQSSFRVLVTDAYKRRCAITGETTLVALEAAHIVPYSQSGSHDVRNGLLLRADFHRLFDVGLVSITQDMEIKVSRKIREAWFNGKVYYELNNQRLRNIPDFLENRPDPDCLSWHYTNRFQH